MAITKSAKKAYRRSLRQRVFNLRRLEVMKKRIKELKGLRQAGEKSKLNEALSNAYQAIDKAAKRGVIKKNTAARQKSKLAKAIALERNRTPI